ncbi:hypothetical protein VTH06DRAFT_1409 [Thermothelomyces fergusii]
MMEQMDQIAAKSWKLIWDGDGMPTVVSYQFATNLIVECFGQLIYSTIHPPSFPLSLLERFLAIGGKDEYHEAKRPWIVLRMTVRGNGSFGSFIVALP